MFYIVREMETEIEDKNTPLETKDTEPNKKEKRRLSVVTFTSNCVNIPDETGSKSSLSKKYISSTQFCSDLYSVLTVRYSGAERSWSRS